MLKAFTAAATIAALLTIAVHAQDKKPEPGPPPGHGALSVVNDDPFPSTYVRFASRPVVIRNVNILTAAGPLIRNGAIVLRDGKVAQVGATVEAPADAQVIDGAGKLRHAGHHRRPLAPRRLRGAGRRRAERRQRDDEPVDAAGLGGALDLAAGSAVPPKPRRRRHDAPGVAGIGEPDRRPQRRAEGRAVAHRAGHEVSRRALRPEDGVRREPEARLRAARPLDADGQRRRLPRGLDSGRRSIRRKWDAWTADKTKGDAPDRDLAIETLAEVLRGNIYVHNHCYRADEMAQMIDIAHEFGYKIRSVPPRRRGLQDRRPAREGRHRRIALGRLGRVQDGGARRRRRRTAAFSPAPAPARSCTPTIRPVRSG